MKIPVPSTSCRPGPPRTLGRPMQAVFLMGGAPSSSEGCEGEQGGGEYLLRRISPGRSSPLIHETYYD